MIELFVKISLNHNSFQLKVDGNGSFNRLLLLRIAADDM